MKSNEDPGNAERLINILNQLDFQHIVDWNNEHSEQHQDLPGLTDDEFTRLMGYLIQFHSHRISREIISVIPMLKDELLIQSLNNLAEQLHSWSLYSLSGQQAYQLAGFWATQRRLLLTYLQ